jgi:hypothetical protein
VKADEIRKQELSVAANTNDNPTSANIQDCAFFLREIAAQLAELNETLKSNSITTHVVLAGGVGLP